MPDNPRTTIAVGSRPMALLIAVGLVAFLSGGWLLHRGVSRSSGVYEKARLLDSVITLLSDYYVDSLNAGQLYDLATSGMLSTLGDPYTEFLEPDDFEALRVNTEGSYIGIGIRIEINDGWITVVTPLEDTPADEAGIDAGDRVVAVGGTSTRAWSADDAVQALRGDSGTTVELTVARSGVPEFMPFVLTRTRIHVTPVRHTQLLEDDVGYVRLETISEQSAEEVADAVTRLREQGARSLILDLRFNPGGLLDEGIAVSDLFLEPGAAVVETRGRLRVLSRTYEADHPEQWATMPVVVLVNEFSASAAEIIAGALQDHDRALVMGTTTFGKGLVQQIFQINRTEALRLTTSRWYTPSGRSIHREDQSSERSQEESPGLDGTSQDTIFHSVGGRSLMGGGGVRPDIVAEPEPAGPGERRWRRVLGADLQVFLDVLGSYALEIMGSETVTDPSTFEVKEPMRRALMRRLRERGIDIPAAIWDSAGTYVDQQLRSRVLRYVFGRDVEMQDQIGNDAVVRRAVDLLKQAETPEQLFAVASAEASGDGR